MLFVLNELKSGSEIAICRLDRRTDGETLERVSVLDLLVLKILENVRGTKYSFLLLVRSGNRRCDGQTDIINRLLAF